MNRVLGAVRSLFGVDVARRDFIRNQRNLRRVREAMLVLAPGHALPCEGVALASADASRWQHEQAPVSAAQMFMKGTIHFSGANGVPLDREKGFQCFERAAAEGHTRAMYARAACMINGEGTKRDLAQGLRLMDRLAAGGFPQAQSTMGMVLYEGPTAFPEAAAFGFPQDHKRALKLFMSAAKQGDLMSINSVATMLANGEGGKKDEERAAKWYEVAAEAGDAAACSVLGLWYSEGRAGLPVDKEKGFALNLKAAERGIVQAQHNVGCWYLMGNGVEQDVSEAAKWFEKAAEAGSVQSMMNLSKLYANGEGVEEDPSKALEWFSSAMTAQKLSGGRFDLGEYGLKAEELFRTIDPEEDKTKGDEGTKEEETKEGGVGGSKPLV